MTEGERRPPLPRIELDPPDIACWRAGNTGTDHVWRFDSGRPGPQVMVQALTHGNELCGAIALDWLLRRPALLAPPRGALTLAFANVEAFLRWDPQAPGRSRHVDEDLNRVWDDAVLAGPRDSVELRRARALRPFVDAADLLLDIHSMSEQGEPLMVCGATGRGGDKAAACARRLGLPGVLLIDTGHPSGLRMIERGGFADPADPRCALLIECGQHWERRAADVALDALLRFLQWSGAAPAAPLADALGRHGLARPARQRLVRVSEAVVARSAAFRFEQPYRGLEVIARAGTVIARDGDALVRTPHDDTVLVMPAAHAAVVPGTTMVRFGRYEA